MRSKTIKISVIMFIAFIAFICIFSNTKVQATLLDKPYGQEFMIPSCKRYEYTNQKGENKYSVLPKYPGYTIYCTNTGARFDFVQSITKSEIDHLLKTYKRSRKCGCFGPLTDEGHTYPYYQKVVLVH